MQQNTLFAGAAVQHSVNLPETEEFKRQAFWYLPASESEQHGRGTEGRIEIDQHWDSGCAARWVFLIF